MKQNYKLIMPQIEADILSAEDAIERAEKLPPAKAKYIKGLAGYHLQQASEKLIKIQLYASGHKLNYAKLYKHSLDDTAFLKIRVAFHVALYQESRH